MPVSHLPSRLHGAALAGAAGLVATASSPSLADTTVFVTANPLAQAQRAQPGSVLGADALLLRRGGTLAEALDGLPGVAASWFGPNSSRPVIRGLDGERVRLLESGSAAVDASSLSFDHAVAVDLLLVERVEVLRGPAALLYGANATGGVVNAIDNRIPRAPQAGLSGRTELRLGGASAERAAAVVLDGGAGRWAWHANAFGRSSRDLKVPGFLPPAAGSAWARRVRNSAAAASGGAVGGSWADDDGHVGLALDSYGNRYGVTVEPDVHIDMAR
ncbi:MAG: TonB-dependent receptor plug domain-containing protein, partial [Rubrivivax sp.]|nr:TonB-dependent receptor plug domain-containing protein [Rubrivivax sp.]